MEWFKPKDKLPSINERRVLAFVKVEKQDGIIWYGFVDVYFDVHFGWRRCETEEPIYVDFWTYKLDSPGRNDGMD